MVDPFVLVPKEQALSGIMDKTLRVVGSVVRYAFGENKGKIHSHLQPTSGSEFAQKSMLALDGLKQGQDAMQSMLGGISGGVQMLQVMSGINLALSVADIGISVAGFAIMNAKLNAVHNSIQSVARDIEFIKMDSIERDFAKLNALSQRYEDTWYIKNFENSKNILLNIIDISNEISILFENHAKNILDRDLNCLSAADRMLDGMALTVGLRVSAAMAANENLLAERIANEGAKKILALTGSIGEVDIINMQLPNGIDLKSREWTDEFSNAQEKAAPVIAKLRLREANAYTRSAPLPVIEARGITPREWLTAARIEENEPLLFLAG